MGRLVGCGFGREWDFYFTPCTNTCALCTGHTLVYMYDKARPRLLLKFLSLGLGLVKLLAILPSIGHMHTCSIVHWTHVIIFYAYIYMVGDW